MYQLYRKHVNKQQIFRLAIVSHSEKFETYFRVDAKNSGELFRQIGKCLGEIESMEKRHVNQFMMNIWTGMTINLLDNIMVKGERRCVRVAAAQ